MSLSLRNLSPELREDALAFFAAVTRHPANHGLVHADDDEAAFEFDPARGAGWAAALGHVGLDADGAVPVGRYRRGAREVLVVWHEGQTFDSVALRQAPGLRSVT